MIKLEVEDYCQDCPHFEADVDKQILYAGETPMICNTYIRCDHRMACDQAFIAGVKKGTNYEV